MNGIKTYDKISGKTIQSIHDLNLFPQQDLFFSADSYNLHLWSLDGFQPIVSLYVEDGISEVLPVNATRLVIGSGSGKLHFLQLVGVEAV